MQTATAQTPRAGYPNPVPYEEPEGRGCGCYIKGCLILVVLFVMVCAVGGYLAWTSYKQMVQDYTATEPEEIPVVEIERRKMKQLESRLEAFEKAIEAEPELGEGGPDFVPNQAPLAKPENQREPVTLKLTATELNALIAKSPKFRGRVLTEIVDGQIKAQVSLPIDDVPGMNSLPGIEGRFFNGNVTLEVAKEGQEFTVRVADAVIKGKPVPENWMNSLRKENLAEKFIQNPKTAEIIEKIDTIEVVEDGIVIKLRSPPSSSP